MAKKNRIYLPLSTGGLIKYAEEEESKLKLDPRHLVWLVIAAVIFEILLAMLI